MKKLNKKQKRIDNGWRCKKIKYKSKRRALMCIKARTQDPYDPAVPLRAYYCNRCNKWHITSSMSEWRYEIVPPEEVVEFEKEMD